MRILMRICITNYDIITDLSSAGDIMEILHSLKVSTISGRFSL